MGKKILAVIPARGGSKGLVQKNIKSLLGKPLISWTIEHACESKYIDEIFVSTDCQRIADIAIGNGAIIPFLRPAQLASDTSSTVDVINHTLGYFESIGKFFDILVLLEPTSPLRKAGDIDGALEILVSDVENQGVVTVGEVHLEHPSIVKKIEASSGGLSSFVSTDLPFHQRQQLGKAYFPYGVAYVVRVDVFKSQKTFYPTVTKPYLLERWQNFEVDDLVDFLCIEKILSSKMEGIL